MAHEELEMPDEYKQHLAHLTQFLEDRERLATQIKDLPVDRVAEANAQLRKFDEAIDGLEKLLANEYERHQAENASEAELSQRLEQGMEYTKVLYIIVKHQHPEKLEKFADQCLASLTPEEREQFLDDVAVIESTQLDAILKQDA